MHGSAAAPSGIDAALLAARRAWFGVLFLLSRESKSSNAGFVVTTLADVIQFSVFPLMTAVAVMDATTFQAAATVLSVAILDVDTLFALADANSGAGRAVLFWLALAIVVVFLGMLAYVMGTIITEGRQQAIVLRALASLASVLTTVAFMPAASLLLSVFHSCASVEALGVGCQTDGHWIVIALVVTVLTVFTAVATFFATVYIDTDLKSTALGAKVTGRVDAAMLVAKLVLVVCFTAMSLPPTVQTILAGAAALTWLLGTVFVQPHVHPLANNVAAAAAALNTWLVVAVGVRLVAPESGIDAFMVLGLVLAPALGFFGNSGYSTAVAASDFASLRSSLQADVWARTRVTVAQRLQASGVSTIQGSRRPRRRRGGSTDGQGAQSGGYLVKSGTRKHGATFASRPGDDSHMRGRQGGRVQGQASGLARPPSRSGSLASLLGPDTATAAPLRVHVLADNGANDSDSDSAVPVTTADLLPGVTPEGLIRQASMAYDEMLKAWPKSAVTYSSGSIFHRAYGSTASSELTILAMARKQVGSAWDVSFLSYQRTRQLQERSGSGLSAVDRILFDEAWSTAIEETTNAFAAQNKLYNHAVESNPDARKLGLLAEELFKARTAAERRFRTMLQINPDSIMALRAYSRFCEEVLHDADRATELMNKANRIEDKHAKTNVRPLDAVVVGAVEEPLSVMDEMNAVITMTGELRRYGEITDANVATARLFGRGRSDLVGQSLASLFPEPLGSLYDAAILAYLSPHEKGEAFSRGAHVSVVQTAGGWLAPVRVSLQEGAGSELDATPSLSMVVQRAPTKRRMMVVGDAESGFPVLALDAESMALLGDEAMDEDDDDGIFGGGDDVDSTGAAGSDGAMASEMPMAGKGMRWTSSGGGLTPGRDASGAAAVASRELPLVQWLPDLGRLALSAMSSASGAAAELVVRGSMYNEDEDADAVPIAARAAFADQPAAPVRGNTEGSSPGPRTALLGGTAGLSAGSFDATATGVTEPGTAASGVTGPGSAESGGVDLSAASPGSAARLFVETASGSVSSSVQSGQPRSSSAAAGQRQRQPRRQGTAGGAAPGAHGGPVVRRPIKLRVGLQALHPTVLAGKRMRSSDPPPMFWLVTWEPPRGPATSTAARLKAGRAASVCVAGRRTSTSFTPSGRASPMAAAGAATDATGRAVHVQSQGGAGRRGHRVNRSQGGAAGPMGSTGRRSLSVDRKASTRGDASAARPSMGSSPFKTHAMRVSGSSDFGSGQFHSGHGGGRTPTSSMPVGASGLQPTFASQGTGEPDAQGAAPLILSDPQGSSSVEAGDLYRIASRDDGGFTMQPGGRLLAQDGGATDVDGPGNGGGSVTSAMASATRVTKLVVETALSKGDPQVTRIRAVVMASLFAVIAFAIAIAIAVPATDAGAERLLLANSLAQRRLYHSDSASNAWYQLISVSIGFTAVNNWNTLTANLTQNIDRMEAAHRELLAVSQTVQGELARLEQERSWDVCTSSNLLYTCQKHELMSSSDLVEFNIFHLRQIAATTPAAILSSPSFLTIVPNIDLTALALHRSERASATELAQGMESRLATMSTALITAAVLTFALATVGTTWLMAAIGRQRFRLLASVPQVPRKQLRELARQAEEAQLAFARAVGADTGEDEGGMMDVEMEDGDRTPRMDLTGAGNGRGGGSQRRMNLAGGRQSRQPRASGGDTGSPEASGTVRGGTSHQQVRRFHLDGKNGGRGGRPARSTCCGVSCCATARHGGRRDRRVADSSCFVWKASLRITSPLSLIGAWIAVVLFMVNGTYYLVTVDAARSERLHSYAAGASALRGQLELALLVTNNGRVMAMEEARTNSTRVLQSLGAMINGDDETSYDVRLPALAESSDVTSTLLFEIMIYDSCAVLPVNSYIWKQCRSLHDEYGLRGLHSFTTAMLDDGVQARAIFDENNATDSRGLSVLIRTGALSSIIPPLQRYARKADMSDYLIRALVNVTDSAAERRFQTTWADVQLVLGVFAGGFIVIVWLWALPSVRKLENNRRALYSVMLSLPDEVILGTPAVTEVLVGMATYVGLTQAARALKSLAKSAMDQSRRQYRIAAAGGHLSKRRSAGPAVVHPSQGYLAKAGPELTDSTAALDSFVLPHSTAQKSLSSAHNEPEHSQTDSKDALLATAAEPVQVSDSST
ncbi:hypothetical protein FNF27_06413 [Cafeteria roenbergensis]|uniref:TmcB/TmcC TPR repeats domain-containing protein n=1 Tax=Cafeteria roenbergensis TaxID=33653 RepID=A0A5A8E0U5_CAFRO|nr:hypothetical protein FNF27_06413 [Cafeteria roenbergensis]